VRFTAEGLDSESAEKTSSIAVSGSVILPPPRRYSPPLTATDPLPASTPK
jgi:hypothetical protein